MVVWDIRHGPILLTAHEETDQYMLAVIVGWSNTLIQQTANGLLQKLVLHIPMGCVVTTRGCSRKFLETTETLNVNTYGLRL